jgi:ABC-2 type transport system ATP-binding protein
MNPVISVKNLSKSFNGKPAVQNISLQVNRGDIFGFLGPNGSGKTTTIRMISGLLTPDAGSGTCMGFDIARESDCIKEKIGYMTQRFSLYDDLTIEENLDFSARLYQVDDAKDKVERALRELKLQERRKQLTGTLSGGWKQRLALTACLLHEPDLLLLDEPTAGVDPKARREFWDEIKKLSLQGVTTLVSTHYMDEAARCNQLAFIAEGKLLITGSPEEIIKNSGVDTNNLEEVFVRLLS